MKIPSARPEPPSEGALVIHVVEPPVRSAPGSLRCEIGQQIRFSTTSLESYFFSSWAPDVWDALLVAAAVEFADRTKHRPAYKWQRHFELRVPVHNPRHWNSLAVQTTLRDALELLTGDEWHFEFAERNVPVERPQQIQLRLDPQVEAVIPFSNGLDSCAVAGLTERRLGTKLVRIRLGSGLHEGKALSRERKAFTRIPYELRPGTKPFVETSARSRGFKFAVISGIAAHLSTAGRVIVPESGQGALGPSLVTVGQAREDYRCHPVFTRRMEKFLNALLGSTVAYEFPQIWSTKAETLRRYVDECSDPTWTRTKSCWQKNRHSSVGKKWRHCGICAACMLRRLSIHAAGLEEPRETYIWENLGASTFKAGTAASFPEAKVTPAMHQYAIAGALHLDHLAALRDSSVNAVTLDLSAYQLSETLGLTEAEARQKLDRLLQKHSHEWNAFLDSVGNQSFLHEWAAGARS